MGTIFLAVAYTHPLKAQISEKVDHPMKQE